MLGTQHLALFVVSGILLNLTPGQDTFYIVGRSATQGRRAGILSVLGIVSGSILHTLAAAFGLSAILATSARAFLVVKFAGACLSRVSGRHSAARSHVGRRARLRMASGWWMGDLPRRFSDQSPQSEGGALLHGVPAAVRGSGCGVEDPDVLVSWRSVHLHRHAMVSGPRLGRFDNEPPAPGEPVGERRAQARDRGWSSLGSDSGWLPASDGGRIPCWRMSGQRASGSVQRRRDRDHHHHHGARVEGAGRRRLGRSSSVDASLSELRAQFRLSRHLLEQSPSSAARRAGMSTVESCGRIRICCSGCR